MQALDDSGEEKVTEVTEETSDRTKEKEQQQEARDKTLGKLVETEPALKPRIPAERYKEDNLLGMDCDLTHSYHHCEVAKQPSKTDKIYSHITLIKSSI